MKLNFVVVPEEFTNNNFQHIESCFRKQSGDSENTEIAAAFLRF